jgi:N-acetylglucosaminyldiphosphoundecaprenol N-acetyl-beta-D-mannosaminyltransferase
VPPRENRLHPAGGSACSACRSIRSGLPEAVERVRADAFAGRRCWIATPNLNFAIAARSDAAFRQSVLRSDLSLVDGMPLIWMARALGVPMPQRVAGSDLFEALQAHPGPPLGVYLFGGPPGVAARAAERINAQAAACAASASTRPATAGSRR